jgi:hypothetical protein
MLDFSFATNKAIDSKVIRRVRHHHSHAGAG